MPDGVRSPLLARSREVSNDILRGVGSMGVQKAQEVHQGSAFPMVVVSGAKNLVATKVRRAEQLTANLMVEGNGAKS
ncbi:hypothetical protein E2562_004297 [Oryza meyeriana var. granulata]|uniref:Uncharacterized protein n=1 Tax=Oryza meyeriana var. granulata TaxID=110450 RepID=A0A6G1BSK7_9ORYZ|nr:hypothetical protein E2562_004297 [Oryza meyeriana var. granulata]